MAEKSISVGIFLDNREWHAVTTAVQNENDPRLLNLKFKHLKEDMTTKEILGSIEGMEILIAEPSVISVIINAVPLSVKWIHSTWSGLDRVVNSMGWQKAKEFQPHFKVTKMQNCYGVYMADYVIGAVFAMERQFFQMFKDQQRKQWLSTDLHLSYRQFQTLTFGILGLGNIGMDVAKKAKLLGFKLCALKKGPPDDLQRKLVGKIFSTEEMDEFLTSCDYICNVLPGTKETNNLLSGDRLMVCAAKKPGFINVGRGNVISEESLINALDKGWISGAFLDVFDKEPLPPNNPLWEHDKVVVTPHVSCCYLSDAEFGKTILKYLKQYVNKEPFTNEFQWQKGY